MPTQVITPPAPSQIASARELAAADEIFEAVFERSTQFRIELPWEQAIQVIRRIDRWNEYEAERVIEALEHVDEAMPRKYCGENHPSNGERDFTIAVGLKGSPVIYLERREYRSSIPMQESAMKAACQAVKLIGRADEAFYDIDQSYPYSPGRKITFCFWWD
jgi:hypothetical protein